MVNVCFKCHKAYDKYTFPKQKGEFKPEQYSKYICQDCYNNYIKKVRNLQNKLEGMY